MAISALPSADRGDVTVQPAFFTSSLFVNPMRDDITLLVRSFTDQYDDERITQPFSLFKSIWTAQGWPLFHFKAFDARARQAFLHVVFRLFLERFATTEPVNVRVAAFFSLYIFFKTQPRNFSPSLQVVDHIPITCDVLTSLFEFPTHLNTLSLRSQVSFLLADLMLTPDGGPPFHILPLSNLQPHNPQSLPREIFVESDDLSLADTSRHSHPALSQSQDDLLSPLKRGRGRPSKQEKQRKTREAVRSLAKWLETDQLVSAPFASSKSPSDLGSNQLTRPPTNTSETYRRLKASVIDSMAQESTGALRVANDAVLQRVRLIHAEVEETSEVDPEGAERVHSSLRRLERAMDEFNNGRNPAGAGVLGLLEGAGL